MPTIIHGQSLQPYNTFNIKAQCTAWSTFDNDDSLIELIDHCKRNALQWKVLGGGSNILFSKDFQGMIIHPVSKSITRTEQGMVVADAGVVWDEFVAWSMEQSLCGIENLSHIPGTVGAAPVQNVGAYGVEASNTIRWVEYLDTQSMKIERIENRDCCFGYRESIFKHELRDRAIVVRVAFNLSEQMNFNVEYGDVKAEIERLGGLSLHNVRQAIINIRSSKLPDPRQIGSGGSFFKNPVIETSKAERLKEQYPNIPHFMTDKGVKIPAGWLIDKAGWKGYRTGDAGVHPQQALVLVNYGTATADQIMTLANQITSDIKHKFDIELEKEINVW